MNILRTLGFYSALAAIWTVFGLWGCRHYASRAIPIFTGWIRARSLEIVGALTRVLVLVACIVVIAVQP